MNGLLQDLRYALRQLRKSPAFTAVAVITLALGIGANTAIFSLIDAVMLRTVSAKDPERLVLLKWKAKAIPHTKGSASYDNCPQGSGPALGGGAILSDVPLDSQGCSFSLPFFNLVQSQRRIFSDVTALVPTEFSMNSDGRTSHVHGLFVSGDFFSTLGVRPALGRLLRESDDSDVAAPAIVLSHRFWRSELAGDPMAVGKLVLIGKTAFTIVGIASPEFVLDPGLPGDVWVPLAVRPVVPPYPPKQLAVNAIWMELIGRLQSGVTADQASSALSSIFSAASTSGPDAMFTSNDAPRIELASAAQGLATLRRNFSQALFALMVAVALVLFISCVNISGLMLARSAARRREIGTRVALGASRGRIVSQVLSENLLLSLAGGAVGILLGELGARVLVTFLSRNWSLPLELDVHPDGRVLVFTLVVSVLVAFASALVPALSSGRRHLLSFLRTEMGSASPTTGRRFAIGSLIVVVQIAIAMPILTGAALVVRTLGNLKAESVGFEPQHLLVFRVDSDFSQKNRNTLYRDLEDQFASLPGVTSVSRSGVALLSNSGMAGPIRSDGSSPVEVRAHGLPMSSNFLATMGIPLRQGRVFTDGGPEGAPQRKDVPIPVVVNEKLVHLMFGAENPIGKHFHLGGSGPFYEVTGVVGDAKYSNMRDTIWPTVYMPIRDWNGDVYLEIRTAMDPARVIPEIRSTVARFDSSLLVADMKTEVEQIDQDLYQERLMSALAGLFAALALVVACTGVYGLLAFQTARRVQEIGIRLALGARRGDVLQLMLRQGATLAIAGAVIGCAAALLLTRYLQAFLFGVKSTDVATVTAMAALLIAVAVVASYIPARRAANVDPIVALRYE
jgi:macrolide transport system ATP-binding/permease protein